MRVEGYKVFNKGLINCYGKKFEAQHEYKVDTSKRSIEYGIEGYGFHFAKRLEDCLRFFDGMNEDIEIAKVVSIGEVKESYDDYNGYYDLYVTDQIYIERILTRKEIVDYIKHTSFDRIERFISGYRLTEKEIDQILENDKLNILDKTVEYYQYGNKDAYTKCKSSNLN